MSLADKLNYLKQTKNLIKQAINNKGGTLTDDSSFRSYADEINNIKVPIVEKDINFYDCDFTLLYSYTLEEIQNLSELPPLPTREGLICQGWNWTLSDIQAYGKECDIGAYYITDDESTRIYVELEDGGLSPTLNITQSVANGVTVDWGDGSPTETSSAENASVNLQHTYQNAGNYIISLQPINETTITLKGTTTGGSYIFHDLNITDGQYYENVSYLNTIKKIEIGKNTIISDSAFGNCYSLEEILIPNTVTSMGRYAFNYCYSLKSIVLPYNMTTFSSNMFVQCCLLKNIILPSTFTTFGTYIFTECYNLEKIIFPDSVTQLGGYFFSNCYALTKVVLSNHITWLSQYCFSGCRSLRDFDFSNISVVYGSAFSNCLSLEKAYMPNVSTISRYAFSQCYSLKSVVLPSRLTRIEQYTFSQCSSLTSIKIPSTVNAIYTYAFSRCTGLRKVDFSEHTAIPTLQSSVFNNIPTDCKIIVPDNLYDSWIVATNWSDIASLIVKASEV